MTKIAIAKGDGIGPEIMDATLHILSAAGARLEIEEIEIGESVYHKGFSSGIKPEAWDILRRTKVFLKAPITTPQGGGFKSLNVTTRKMLGLYANVRPCMSYHPFIESKHPEMDVVIIRENEEDLYAGIEHQQTDEVVQCLKLISRPGCEKIIRYAFEYATLHNRKKVTCFTKDNIMKMTDGLFHKIFDEVAKEYPNVENEHWIIDIGAAKLAETPNVFDVIVTPNLYGDIISDVAAQITGSVGLAGSANIGDHCAMFEAIHGSAPRRAGQNMANPSGLLLGAVQMLVHIDQPEIASRVHNAWLRTVEQGIHTYDIYKPGKSSKKVSTSDFAKEVIARIGEFPSYLRSVEYKKRKPVEVILSKRKKSKKETVGVDIFLHWSSGSPDQLGQVLNSIDDSRLKLDMITNRGVKVFPGGIPETFCTDHWRCRFVSKDSTPIDYSDILSLSSSLVTRKMDIIKTENLCTFDGAPDSRLDKDNKKTAMTKTPSFAHPTIRKLFSNRKVAVASMHGKELIMRPLVRRYLNMDTSVVKGIDTDQFGTFSGEIQRPSDAVTTLRMKIRKGLSISGATLGIGNEGSFGPHPNLPFVQVNQELCMLIDLENDLEISEGVISTETNHNRQKITKVADLIAFADKIGFPSHGLILQQVAGGTACRQQKGILQWEELYATYVNYGSGDAEVYAETDMRAYLNPTRMKIIERATEKLLRKVTN